LESAIKNLLIMSADLKSATLTTLT